MDYWYCIAAFLCFLLCCTRTCCSSSKVQCHFSRCVLVSVCAQRIWHGWLSTPSTCFADCVGLVPAPWMSSALRLQGVLPLIGAGRLQSRHTLIGRSHSMLPLSSGDICKLLQKTCNLEWGAPAAPSNYANVCWWKYLLWSIREPSDPCPCPKQESLYLRSLLVRLFQ